MILPYSIPDHDVKYPCVYSQRTVPRKFPSNSRVFPLLKEYFLQSKPTYNLDETKLAFKKYAAKNGLVIHFNLYKMDEPMKKYLSAGKEILHLAEIEEEFEKHMVIPFDVNLWQVVDQTSETSSFDPSDPAKQVIDDHQKYWCNPYLQKMLQKISKDSFKPFWKYSEIHEILLQYFASKKDLFFCYANKNVIKIKGTPLRQCIGAKDVLHLFQIDQFLKTNIAPVTTMYLIAKIKE